MTYHAAAIRTAELPKLANLPVLAQSKIVEETGKPLNYSEVYAILKDATSDFKTQNADAQKVDKLFHDVLTKHGFYKTTSAATPPPKKAEPTKKQSLADAIEGLKTLLEFNAANKSLADAIEGLETLLEFA